MRAMQLKGPHSISRVTALWCIFVMCHLIPKIALCDDEAPKRVRISGKLMAQKLIRRVPPEYPADAKTNGIQGVVKLRVVVGTDGHIQQAEILSGDKVLVRAAIDAVRQWQYQPTTFKGQPVEVLTEIDVIFRLGAITSLAG